MNTDELDGLLTDHAQRWLAAQPAPPSIDLARQPVHSARSPLVGRLAIAACVVAVIAVAATAVAIGSRSTRHDDAAAGRSLVTTTFSNGLTLNHPAQWRYVAPQHRGAFSGDDVGFLTNEAPAPQCHVTTDAQGVEGGCGPPVTRLTSDGVLVVVEGEGDAGSARSKPLGSAQTQTIGGYPARVTRTRHPDGCPAGTAEGFLAHIRPPQPAAIPDKQTGPYDIQACLAGPDLQPAERQVHAIFDTAAIYLLPIVTPRSPQSAPTAAELTLADRLAHHEASTDSGTKRSSSRLATGWPSTLTNVSAIVTSTSDAKHYVITHSDWPARVMLIRLLGRFSHVAILPAPGGRSGPVRAETIVIDPGTGRVLETVASLGNPVPLPDSVYLFAR